MCVFEVAHDLTGGAIQSGGEAPLLTAPHVWNKSWNYCNRVWGEARIASPGSTGGSLIIYDTCGAGRLIWLCCVIDRDIDLHLVVQGTP